MIGAFNMGKKFGLILERICSFLCFLLFYQSVDKSFFRKAF